VGAVGHVAALQLASGVFAALVGTTLMLAAVARLWSWNLPGAARIGRMVSQALSGLRCRYGRHPFLLAGGTGVLNALLPCGLVYAALTAALASSSPTNAALFMAGFGAGTVPLLAAFRSVSLRLARVPSPLRRLARPLALAVLGALLIGRGLQLAESAPSAIHRLHHP
jgi:sulfite exporter TauE/SafE